MTDTIVSPGFERIGSYELLDRLGGGGMAEVFRARHVDLNVHRALKLIRPEFSSSERFQKMFREEAQAVARLEHPNIVRVYDFGLHENQFFMIMQLVHGEDLKALLKREGALSPARAVDITVQLAKAVEYAHSQNLVHRDIKPENIMMDSSGVPILMDFGIAKLLSDQSGSDQSTIIGTPGYWSPEQAQGKTITPSTDVYALAVALYEMLTGQPPFKTSATNEAVHKVVHDAPPPPSGFNPDINPTLEAIVLKGLSKTPGDRQSSASELAHELRSSVAMGAMGAMGAVGVAGAKPAIPVSGAKRTTPAYVGLAAALLIAALVLGLAFRSNDPGGVEENLLPLPQPDKLTDLDVAPQVREAVPTAAELAEAAAQQQQIAARRERDEKTRELKALERAARAAEASRPTTGFSVVGAFEPVPSGDVQFRVQESSASVQQHLDLQPDDLVTKINRRPIDGLESMRQKLAADWRKAGNRSAVSDARLFDEMFVRPLDLAGGKVRLTRMRGDSRRDIYCQNFAMVLSCK